MLKTIDRTQDSRYFPGYILLLYDTGGVQYEDKAVYDSVEKALIVAEDFLLKKPFYINGKITDLKRINVLQQYVVRSVVNE